MVPTDLNRVRTVSPSSSVAVPPKHMALAVSPTRQGVLGITLTSLMLSPASSWSPATRAPKVRAAQGTSNGVWLMDSGKCW